MGDNQRVPAASVDDTRTDVRIEAGAPAVTRGRVSRPRALVLDAVCAAAVETARAAAQEVAGEDGVGEHLGAVAEADRLVTHSFRSLAKGYRGWCWAVTVARAPRARLVTVCEIALLPGDDALLAPAWVPWSDRLAPGDLGATDALPYRVDDENLDLGYEVTGDEEADRLALWELGLGRARVLSPVGRRAAAERWYGSGHGPTAPAALHAPAACASCGYLVRLSGGLGHLFGVCANEWSPQDGAVVSLDHGCGAHSETDVERPEPEPLAPPILDETGVEAVVVVRDTALTTAAVADSGASPDQEQA